MTPYDLAREDRGTDEIIADFTVDDLPWSGGRKLYQWWLDACGDRPFPSRRDFSPAVMGSDLQTMVLHDVEAGTPRFRIRLAGTEVADLLGRDPTGKTIYDFPNAEKMAARYEWLLQHRRGYHCRRLPLRWAGKQLLHYETVVLPLGRDGVIDMLIANIAVTRTEPRPAPSL